MNDPQMCTKASVDRVESSRFIAKNGPLADCWVDWGRTTVSKQGGPDGGIRPAYIAPVRGSNGFTNESFESVPYWLCTAASPRRLAALIPLRAALLAPTRDGRSSAINSETTARTTRSSTRENAGLCQ